MGGDEALMVAVPSAAVAGRRSGDARRDASRPRITVTRHVVDALFEMLRSGEFQLGDRLPSEWELVEALHVGRSAVREAIRELVTLELVEIRPGRGTFVRSLRPDLLLRPEAFNDVLNTAVKRELLEVRRILEPEAAALAAARATDGEIERLRYDVDRLRDAVRVGYRPPEDLGFHLNVVRATHNTALSRVAGAIVGFYERDGVLPTERDTIEHGAICEAIARHDGDAARVLMRDHLSERGGAAAGRPELARAREAAAETR
jgi:GntR family transcriptional repressor for pyruvate dehydrogenase complex